MNRASHRRKPGRPKLPKSERAQVLAVRLTPAERRLIEKAAKLRKETVSAWIRATLVAAGEMEILNPT